jgi:hypothetical protein
MGGGDERRRSESEVGAGDGWDGIGGSTRVPFSRVGTTSKVRDVVDLALFSAMAGWQRVGGERGGWVGMCGWGVQVEERMSRR